MRIAPCLFPSLVLSLVTQADSDDTTLKHYKPVFVVGDMTPTTTRANSDNLDICLMWCQPEDDCFIVIYDSVNQECQALDQHLLATPTPDENGTLVYANMDYGKSQSVETGMKLSASCLRKVIYFQ